MLLPGCLACSGMPRAPSSGMPGLGLHPKWGGQLPTVLLEAPSSFRHGVCLSRQSAWPEVGGPVPDAPLSVLLLSHGAYGDLSLQGSTQPGSQLSSGHSALGSTQMCCLPGFQEFFCFLMGI